MQGVLLPLLLAFFAGIAPARASDVAEPVAGELRAGAELADPAFGVRARALGLERTVEMLQWQRRPDGGYATQWRDHPVPDDGHDPAHRNPSWPEFRSERWFNESAVLDGRSVDPALLAGLGGWEPLAIDHALLPANLAVVFQPDGEGLSSSADPGAPEVGDLRLRWRMLPEGPVHGRAVERDGRWIAGGEGGGWVRGTGEAAIGGDEFPAPDLPPRLKSEWLLWAAGAFALLLLALYLRRKR